MAVAAAALLVAGTAACSRNGGKQQVDKSPMETQTASTPPNAGPMTLTVTGCLGAGAMADTYVLIAARTNGATDTVTYQLEGANTAELRAHIGERVRVSGQSIPEADVASNSTTTQEPTAKGTSGTPAVQTRTELQIQRLRAAIGHDDEEAADVTRGTLILRFSFAIDVREWGFADPRGDLIRVARSQPVIRAIGEQREDTGGAA